MLTTLLLATTAMMNPNPLLPAKHCVHSLTTGTPIPDGPNGNTAAAIVSVETVWKNHQPVGYLYKTTLGHLWLSLQPTELRHIANLPSGYTATPCVSVEDKVKP